MANSKFILSIAGMLGLMACAKVPTHGLNQSQIDAIGIAQINVTIAEDAKIKWHDAEEAFAENAECYHSMKTRSNDPGAAEQAASASGCDVDALVASPEAQASLRGQAIDVFENALRESVGDLFDGTRLVDINAEILSIRTLSGLQLAIVGGKHSMGINLEVIDHETQDLLTAYPAKLVLHGQNGLFGVIADNLIIGDPVAQMAKLYANGFTAWMRTPDPTLPSTPAQAVAAAAKAPQP